MLINHIKKTNSDFTYVSIVESIRRTGGLPKLDMPKQTRTYYIKRLKLLGVIEKKGYGTYSINEKVYKEKLPGLSQKRSKRSPSNQVLYTPRVRGHNFLLVVKLPVTPPLWRKRDKILERLKIPYKKIMQGISFKLRSYTIWLCSSSVIIYFPQDKSIFSYSAGEAKLEALHICQELIVSLENIFQFSFRINKRYRVKISKQHYAKIKDALAKYYNTQGKKLYIEYAGKGWLLIDNSLNLDELETIHKDTGVPDLDKVIVPFFNDLKAHYEATGEAILPTDILKMILGLTRNAQMYAENTASHIKAVQNLGAGVQRFNKTIEKFNQRRLSDYEKGKKED